MFEVDNLPDIGVFQYAIEQLEASVVITDASGTIVYANPYFSENTGYTQEEAIGLNPSVLKSGLHTPDEYKELWSTILSGKTWRGELCNKRKDGTLFWERVSISPLRSEQGEIINFIAIKQDITHEKEKNSRTKKIKDLLDDIQVISNTGGWLYEVDKDEMYWTDELYHIHGYDANTDISHIKDSLSCYHPEDRHKVKFAYKRLLEDGTPYDLTVRFTDIQGKDKWIRTKTHGIRGEDGNIQKVVGSVMDVTSEVETKLELERNLNKFELVINAFDDIVFILDKDGRHKDIYGQWANDELKDMLLGKTAIDAFGEQDGEIHRIHHGRAIRGEHARYTWSVATDREAIYYDTKLSPLQTPDGTIHSVLGVTRNITDRVVYEHELERTKNRFEYAVKGTLAGVWEWDIQSGELAINNRWAHMLGYTIKELSPVSINTWERFCHPEDLKKAKAFLKEHLSGESNIYDATFRMRHKDGHWVHVWSRGAVFQWDEQGKPKKVFGTHIDITNTVMNKERLQKSEKIYKDLFRKSHSPKMITKYDRIIDCNEEFLKAFGLNDVSEVKGKSVLDLSPEWQPDEHLSVEREQNLQSRLSVEGFIAFEWNYLTRPDKETTFEVVVTEVQDLDGQMINYHVLNDLTRQKEAEQKLIDAFNDRGILLSEIHHRVKNNLAVISGLLQLQVLSASDDVDTGLLEKSIQRINTIALIHEQLYTSENFSDISIVDHIKNQVENLAILHQKEKGADIDLNMELHDVTININQALPLGLLINEILTNAYNYAFVDRDTGTIDIKLFEEDSTIHLNIKDNGIGMDKAMIEDEGNIGHLLIKNLLMQLEAVSHVETEGGVSYQIEFEKRDLSGSAINKALL